MRRLVTWTVRSKNVMLRAFLDAPVAQLDRVLVSEAKGHRFDSCRARQLCMNTGTEQCPFLFCADAGMYQANCVSPDVMRCVGTLFLARGEQIGDGTLRHLCREVQRFRQRRVRMDGQADIFHVCAHFQR